MSEVDIVFKAEVFQVIRANEHKTAQGIKKALRDHFPDTPTKEITKAINELIDK